MNLVMDEILDNFKLTFMKFKQNCKILKVKIKMQFVLPLDYGVWSCRHARCINALPSVLLRSSSVINFKVL